MRETDTLFMGFPVGNYERYSLAEDNTGHPQLVTYVATYPSEAEIPPTDVLRSRARKLVEDFPLLRGRVVDGRTTSPKWEVLSEEAVERGMEKLVSDKSLMDLVSLNVFDPREPFSPLLLFRLHRMWTASSQVNLWMANLCE